MYAGATFARAGFAAMTGGYGGTMEAVSLGAHHAGGHVIGVTAPPLFPQRQGANPYVAEEIPTESLARCIDEMLLRASGALALPGSIGTATELLISWNTIHIAHLSGNQTFPTAAVGPEWRRIGTVLASAIDAPADQIHWTDTVDGGVNWLLDRLESL